MAENKCIVGRNVLEPGFLALLAVFCGCRQKAAVKPSQPQTQAAKAEQPQTAAKASAEAFQHYQAGLKAKEAKDYATAADELSKAVKLSPDYADAHAALGWIYLAKKEKDKAIAEFQEAFRLAPESDAGSKAAKALVRLGTSSASTRDRTPHPPSSLSTHPAKEDILGDKVLFGGVSAELRACLAQLAKHSPGMWILADWHGVYVGGGTTKKDDPHFDLVGFVGKLKQGSLGQWRFQGCPLDRVRKLYGDPSAVETTTEVGGSSGPTQVTWHIYGHVWLGTEGRKAADVTWVKLWPTRGGQ